MIALGFGALVVIQAGIEALRSWALRVFGHLLSFQITGNLVRHLLRLPNDYFEKRHVGDIVARLGAVKPIQDAMTQGVISAVIDGIMACVAAVILFFYSTTLAFIVIAAVLINLALNLADAPAHAAAHGGIDRRRGEGADAPHRDGARRHDAETARPRDGAGGRLAKSARRVR